MAWDCNTFERRLAAYEAGDLSESDRRLADLHLRDCEDCRFLLADLAVWSRESPGSRYDLSKSILAKTTGSSCRPAISLLCGFVDEELDPLDRELVAGHLKNCEGCAHLCAVLIEMKTALPALADIAPDSGFAHDVLQETRGLKNRRDSLLGKALSFLAEQVQRPRFSFEAAYLATLLLVVVFGTPISPARRAGPELLAAFQGEKGLVALAGDRASSWRDSAGRSWATIQAVSGRVRNTATAYEAILNGLHEGATREFQEAGAWAHGSAQYARNEAKAFYEQLQNRNKTKR